MPLIISAHSLHHPLHEGPLGQQDLHEEIYKDFTKDYWEKLGNAPRPLEYILSNFLEFLQSFDNHIKPPREDRGEE
jgi:hypothetical protein